GRAAVALARVDPDRLVGNVLNVCAMQAVERVHRRRLVFETEAAEVVVNHASDVVARTDARHAVGVPETHFAEWVAQRYETLWPELFDPAAPEPAVNFLVDVAGPCPALELA